jgi:hypothetical protein
MGDIFLPKQGNFFQQTIGNTGFFKGGGKRKR